MTDRTTPIDDKATRTEGSIARIVDALEIGADSVHAELAQAKEAFSGYPLKYAHLERDKAKIESALTAARAMRDAEPVGEVRLHEGRKCALWTLESGVQDLPVGTKLYTAPPPVSVEVSTLPGYIGSELTSATDTHSVHVRFADRRSADAFQASLAGESVEASQQQGDDVEVKTYPLPRTGGFQPIVMNGIWLRHKPTGIVVSCHTERSTHANAAKAREMLAQALKTSQQPAVEEAEHIKALQDDAHDALLTEARSHGVFAKAEPASGEKAELDPNESNPITLWAEIARLRTAVKGPQGYKSWQSAATDERMRRVKAERELSRLTAENENLQSVMIAAAEEIHEHWGAHCDSEGYGPANLMHRLEKGIPAEYAYKAGDFARLTAELDESKRELSLMRHDCLALERQLSKLLAELSAAKAEGEVMRDALQEIAAEQSGANATEVADRLQSIARAAIAAQGEKP